MAWEEYKAVLDSDLYEQKGLAKPLLARIAHLIIGEPEEGGERDPDTGWCVASEEYLAAQLGCSRTVVTRWVSVFGRDNVLAVVRSRDKRGHLRNKYSLNLKLVKEHAREKDENGEYIRKKNPNKSRESSWASRLGASRLGGSELRGLAAPSKIPRGSEPQKRVLEGLSESSSAGTHRCIPSERAGETPAPPKTTTAPAKLANHTSVARSVSPTTPTVPSGSRCSCGNPSYSKWECRCQECFIKDTMSEILTPGRAAKMIAEGPTVDEL